MHHQIAQMHTLADTNGCMLPDCRHPMTGMDVEFKVIGEDNVRRGQTSFLGGMGRDGMKAMTVFLGEDFSKTNQIYPVEKVSHWRECETN